MSTKTIRQAHGLMMEDAKDVLVGEYRKSPVFAGYHIFAPVGYIEWYMEDTIFKFPKTKKDDPIMTTTNFLETSIYIHLKMEMEEFVAWFWLVFWYRWNVVYFQSF